MRLPFSKMQGLGNDFVVIDATRRAVPLSPAMLRCMADRHFGIGFDQLLMVESSDLPEVDFRYRIFNADGSEVGQCGNGARCFARFVHDQGLTDKPQLRVETASGIIQLRLEGDGQVSVDMGVPSWLPAEIPFLADAPALSYTLTLPDGSVSVSVVSMGNPHAVQRVENIDTAPVAVQGPAIEQHARFPMRVNVGFMQVVDRQHIRLRVYERGAGETLACGTGACAAAVTGIRLGWLDTPVMVAMAGGLLRIEWSGPGQSVIMRGEATHVFNGEIELNSLKERI